MSRNAKITRTQITDLPQGVSVMSAEAMEQVAGGAVNMAFASFGGGAYGGAYRLGATATKPASMTKPGQTDTASDSDR